MRFGQPLELQLQSVEGQICDHPRTQRPSGLWIGLKTPIIDKKPFNKALYNQKTPSMVKKSMETSMKTMDQDVQHAQDGQKVHEKAFVTFKS